MKLNANLLFHEINRYFQVSFAHYNGENWVKTPMFFTKYFRMDEHIVLVASDDLPKCLKRVKHAAIICLDPPAHLPTLEEIGTNDLIILDDPMSDNMAFNILNHILDNFNEWEMTMNDILYHSRNFQDMVDAINDLLGIPLSLTDNHFHYIAFSKDSGEYIDEFVTEQNELPLESIIQLQKSPEFNKLELINGAFLHEALERCVHINIRDRNRNYVGRMSVILRGDNDDEDFCKSVFEVSAPYIEALYEMYNSFTSLNLSYSQAHEYLNQILNRMPADRQGFYQLMNRLGNEDGQEWGIMVLHYREGAKQVLSSSYVCDQLEHDFIACYAIPFKDHIVVLLNQSRNRNASMTKKLENFKKNIAELEIVVGLSRGFRKLTTFEILHFAYMQALYALEFGSIKNPEKDMLFFDEYALDYLITHGSQEITYSQICHPGLLKLSKHDKKQGTSYVETLYTYLNCNMNAVATAKALFIHRSSFINRMERINQQVELNLDDPRERLYLNLSFALYADLLLPAKENA